jgi:hypothetical protein
LGSVGVIACLVVIDVVVFLVIVVIAACYCYDSCCSCCFCCSCCSCNTLLRAATEAANIESRFNLASVALTTARSLRKRINEQNVYITGTIEFKITSNRQIT